MAKMQEIIKKFEQVQSLAQMLAMQLQELSQINGDSKGLLNVYVYEGHRRLEEFMHRAGDCMAVLQQTSEEGVAAAAERALKSGQAAGPGLTVIDGEKKD